MSEYELTHTGIAIDDLRRLFNLAVDSPLICSGSFETDDVELLADIATRIGVDPWRTVTHGTEFESRYLHPFKPRRAHAEAHYVHHGPRGQMSSRLETEAEVQARLAEERADLTCQVARCGRPREDAHHIPGREQ